MNGPVGKRIARLGVCLAVVALASVLAGCSSGAGATSTPGGLTVEGAWARPSTGMAHAEAAYLVIRNPGSLADALIGVSSPVSETSEIHETYALGSPMGSAMPGASSAMGGAMGMRPIPRLEVPAGGSVELKPGSYHIMLIGLKQDVKPGDTIDLTLTFEKAGTIVVKAEVRAS
jgi:hypothetical protein